MKDHQIRQLARDLLDTRKRLFRTQTTLTSLGLGASEVPTVLDLLGMAYELGWDDRQRSRAKEPPTKEPTKPAPKPSLKSAPKPAITKAQLKAQERATEGRHEVLRGERPPIKDAIQQVMGKDVLNAGAILARLQKRAWAPHSSDPKAYIAYVLCSTKERFERVTGRGRGYYRAVANGPEAKAPPKTPPKTPPSPAAMRALATTYILGYAKGEKFFAKDLAKQLDYPVNGLTSILHALQKKGAIAISSKPPGEAAVWIRLAKTPT